ncbi:Acyl-CoA dehydrogenase family member 10 [Sphaceloma murrayae]|uniref:Acyl-CoA dehydrogenase family member 10 n=1 Tax=Sphaceloma murrayae TaxID=2082308 RepID=A0A2K1R1B4_9PEZI|nr:Acyl-CoA dehydrogenase family member 10 [Sphaceloma murrayae]
MSSTVNTNDAGIAERLSLVRSVFRKFFASDPKTIQPLAYEEGFPFPYNNFVYLVTREASHGLAPIPSELPGTQPIPGDHHEFVIRLPNPLSGYNDEVRVENEIASLQLARNALEPELPNLVPHVFGWASAKDGQQGWIMQEFKQGKALLEDFEGMDDEKRAAILGQMADILMALQKYRLPKSIREYGGIAFNTAGDIVSAPMSIHQAGPFRSYNDLVLATIRTKLLKADSEARLQGWHGQGIRARLHDFLEERFGFAMSLVTTLDKTLVHGDFSADNLLYDPATLRLTAVLDFDFAHIGTVADEFFRSLAHGIGRFPDKRDGEETLPLHLAMLHGFPDPLPVPTDDIQWTAAKAWNDALETRDMWRPSNIPGIAQLSELFWLSSQLLPFKLVNEVVISNSSEEQLQARKHDGEVLLNDFLSEHGC